MISYFTIGLISCNNSNYHYKKRLNEAKWLYYESNFTKNKIGCDEVKVIDTNICFIEGLIIDTTQIGDTLEIKIHACLPHYLRCNPNEGFLSNIFGFYPDIDTVVYRTSGNFEGKRIPEITDSISHKWEWAGLYTRPKQKKMFKEFIIKNQNKINSFLKKEAKKRGYIN